MASTTLAYKSSLKISSLSRTIDSVNKIFGSVQETTSTIADTLTKQGDQKRKILSDSSKYFLARREAVRKREQESLIEASSLGGTIKRTGRVVMDSTKGFLGRILDFTGTLLVGWLLTNLPRIIDGAKKLIERMQKIITTLTNVVTNVTDFLFTFGTTLGEVFTQVVSFNFGGIKDTVVDGMNRMNQSIMKLEKEVMFSINLLTRPLDFGFELDKIPEGQQGAAPGSAGTGAQPGSFPAGTYDARRLAQLARAAGIPDDKIPTMVAIALAESGGRSKAHNPDASTGDNSYGLWQINMLGNLGPARRKQFGISSNEELWDPVTNAKAALMILNSQGLGAWSVYKSGAYKDHLSSAQKVFQSIKAQPVKLGTSLSNEQNISGMVAPGGSVSATVTSLYGMRGGKMHRGIDIAAPRGTYIALKVDGQIMGTRNDVGGYGLVIDVWVPAYGVQLRFGHCDKIIQSSGYLPAGKSFATVGSTGRSSGPHIHFEYTKEYNSTKGGSDGDPSSYVPLILLTTGQNSSGNYVSSAKPSAAQIAVTNNKQVAQKITTERKGEEVVVIRRQQKGEPTSPASIITTGTNMIPGGRQLNTFIKDVLFLNLANS